MKMKKLARSIAVVSAVAGGTYISQVNAQILEEVVVTAQKRAQSANDIGVSISAFSNENMEALGIHDAADVMKFTPGATVTSAGQGIPVYTIRGIGFDDYNSNSSSTVGINVDEVALPYPIMTRIPQYDIERIEVLKGPQGTLYGQNTTGGTVNFIRNQAEFENSGSVKLKYQENSRYGLEGYGNVALSDSVAARLSFFSDNGGEWQENAAVGGEGQKNGDQDVQALRLLMTFEPSESVTVSVGADYHKDNSDNIVPQHARLFFINPDADVGGDITGFVTDEITNAGLPDPKDPNSASWNPEGNTFGGDHPRGSFDRNNSGLLLNLRVDWDLEHMTLTSLTSHNDYQRDEANGWDGVATANWDSYNDSEVDVWSQELRLTSNTDGPFSWIAGLYAASDELKEISTGSGVETTANVYITPEDLGEDLNGDDVIDIKDVQVAGLNFDTFSTRYTQETDTLGLFFHTEYVISDAFSLNVGARYTRDERKIIDSCTYDIDGLLANFFNRTVFEIVDPDDFIYAQGDCVTLNPATFASLPYNETIESNNVSGKIGLDWRPTEDLLVYGNISTGYKMGGFGAPAAASWDSLASYKEEEVTSYELGVKSTLAEGRLQLNAAIFHYDYKDKQVSSFIIDPVFGSLTKIVNAPESTVRGAELEINWHATDSTLVRLSSSYLDTQYDEFETYLFGQSLAENPDPINISGSRIQNTPKFQHNLMVHHEFDVSDNMYVFVGGDWSYSDKFNSLVGNDPVFDVDSYHVLKLRAGLASADDSWRVTAWVDNATDENYYTAVSPSNDSNVNILGRERLFGVSFQYNW
ncbi:MAG: TonB-dependent receptor [Pseudomonadales bacterium]